MTDKDRLNETGGVMQNILGNRRLRSWLILGLILVSLGYGYFNGTTGKTPVPVKGTITIGYANWQESGAVSYLWKEILEEQGYNIKLQNLDLAPIYIGLQRGDIDLFFNSWLPISQQNYWEKYKDSLDDYGSWYTGEAKMGIVVPKYVPIESYADLNTYRDKFAGQIIGIDPGAAVTKVVERLIRENNLNLRLVTGSEAAEMAALNKAYVNKKWIAIIGWSPHWMFAKYDLKYLSDDQKYFGKAEGIHLLANKKFAGQKAKVASMLKKFKLDDSQIGGIMAQINRGIPPEQAAKTFIRENRTLVNQWTK